MEYVSYTSWPSVGGGATVATALVTGLERKGHRVTVLVPNLVPGLLASGKRRGSFPRESGTERYGPRLSRVAGNTFGFIFLLLRALPIGFSSDVIIGQHHYSFLSGFCAAIAATVTQRPLVIRVDDVLTEPHSSLEKILVCFFNLCTGWAFRRANLVLVTGRELVSVIRNRYSLDKRTVDLCYNGVDTTKFNPKKRSEILRRAMSSRHIIIFSGGLYPQRGVDVLIQATRLLKRKLPDVKVLIAGDGPDLARLKQMAHDLGLTQTITFLGVINEAYPAYLASADVGVGPTRASIEQLGVIPMKVLEYMASGCVVVTGRGTVSQDLISNGANGLYFKSGDASDLAKTILMIFRSARLADRIRKQARLSVETTYDWKVIVSDLNKKLLLIQKEAATQYRAAETQTTSGTKALRVVVGES